MSNKVTNQQPYHYSVTHPATMRAHKRRKIRRRPKPGRMGRRARAVAMARMASTATKVETPWYNANGEVVA